jgi:hypothetical protein
MEGEREVQSDRMGREDMTRWLLRGVVLVGFIAAALVFLNLVLDSGIVGGGEAPDRPAFTDVPVDHPHRSQIEEVADLEILPGVTDDIFEPDEPVTRARMAQVVVRAMEWPVSASEQQAYDDVQGTDTRIDSADYIAVASARGVMGRQSTEGPPLFKPDDPTKLGQAIVTLVRAGGEALDKREQPDPALAKAKASEPVKAAIAVAMANGLLADTGIDLATTDFDQPVTRDVLAVLAFNFRAAVPPASAD